jgi:hypothetical protein
VTPSIQATKDRLLSFNPLPPALPVIKRGQYPRLVTGQMGTAAFFVYRDWEMEVVPSTTAAPKWPWQVVVRARRHTGLRMTWATTFDGAVCAGKILIDFSESGLALPSDDGTQLRRVWTEISDRAKRLGSAGRLPTRAEVARELQRLPGSSPEAWAWFVSVPLPQRVQLIDDALELRYCMYGADPGTWP